MADAYVISYKNFYEILKTLLREKMVDKIISGSAKRNRFSIAPELISEENKLDEFPLSQLFIYNFDRINSASKYLHKQGGALNEKIAMIGHPCDGRALIELSKRLQVNLDNIFTIIMEDIGTIQAKQIQALLKKENIDDKTVTNEFLTPEKLMLKMSDGSIKEFSLGDKISITDNCSRCYRKKLDNTFDISVTWISLEPFSEQLIIKVGSPKGAKILEKIEKTEIETDQLEKLEKIQNTLISNAEQKRNEDLKVYLENPNRIAEIAKCNMCGVCINSCPVCFCVSCILQNQRKEKSIDNLTYQLTRVSHVGDSCVGCGKCDINCPTGLPLSLYFQSMNELVRKDFGYIAGCDPEAPMPRSHEVIKDITQP